MEANVEDLRTKVLQNTLEQISSLAVGGDTECCVICLGALVEQCEVQPCQHNNFDYICLVTWVQEHPTCPLCKSDVREIRYDLSEDGKQGKIYKVPTQSEGPDKSHDQAECLSRSASLFERQSSSDTERSERALRQYEDEAIQRRRFIYRNNLYSLHVGSNWCQPANSRYRELSPKLFMTDPELVARARTWLCRELCVFEFLYTIDDPPQGHYSVRRRRPSRAEFLHEYIIAILKTIDIQHSTGQAEDMIQEFLGRKNTQLFLHELKAWLRSPYRWLGAWDHAIQYSDGNTLPRASQDVAITRELDF
ncbi:hypothetical protein NUU61_000658 [Penicillium alfredii]|uniref:RING-type E3 ubiquitin transferase n=1 Tax=Penicillium alfredii TaxID=1506179 RepID=A0A9W9KPY3_9EURO|nr:uncharacterized protein NUU61_000658 [Penicillium alfredii]KAJ5114899.1 hypothetical protein NUU61_000658 [Penicillium alfredii]